MPGDFALPDGWRATPPDPWPETGGGPLAVVMVMARGTLDAREALSIATLRRHAPAVPRFLVVPEGCVLAFEHADWRVLRLPRETLGSRAAYNALLLSAMFWRLWRGWAQVLIYQTDCLLLRPGLEAWAARGFDHVGAPWFTRGPHPVPKAVGNGGFSLRRPAAALRVLDTGRLRLARLVRRPSLLRHFARARHAGVLARAAAQGRDAAAYLHGFARPEDEFWSFHAPLFDPGWRMPTPREALGFAFEHVPRRALALTGGALPIGCHGWWKHDEGFWREVLARDGAALKSRSTTLTFR